MSSVLPLPLLPKPQAPHYHILICVWLLSMISLPIVRWSFGDQILPALVGLSVLLQTITVIVILASRWEARRIASLVGVVVPSAWLIELIGSSTGLPFGNYTYTEQLTPQLAHVPLLIPLAWLMMLVPAWAVAYAICGQYTGGKFYLLSALAFTAWDLFLDPQMVGWGFWVWEAQQISAASYFGIPWSNYIGWVLSALLLTWLVQSVVRFDELPVGPLLWIYSLTWLLEAAGLSVFWGLIGPALCGFLAMGAFVVWALWSQTRPTDRNLLE